MQICFCAALFSNCFFLFAVFLMLQVVIHYVTRRKNTRPQQAQLCYFYLQAKKRAAWACRE